jgi:hypothetical protein
MYGYGKVGIWVLMFGREMNRFCYDTGVGLIPACQTCSTY